MNEMQTVLTVTNSHKNNPFKLKPSTNAIYIYSNTKIDTIKPESCFDDYRIKARCFNGSHFT